MHMKESLMLGASGELELCERSPRDLHSPERRGNWMFMIGRNKVGMNSESHLLEAVRL